MPGAAKANAKAMAKSKAQAKALLRKTKAKGRVKKANTRKRARQTALQDIHMLAREVCARPGGRAAPGRADPEVSRPMYPRRNVANVT